MAMRSPANWLTARSSSSRNQADQAQTSCASDSTGKFLFGFWLPYVLDPSVSGSSVSLMDEGFLTGWRSDMQSGSVLVGQVGARVNKSGMF